MKGGVNGATFAFTPLLVINGDPCDCTEVLIDEVNLEEYLAVSVKLKEQPVVQELLKFNDTAS